MTVIFAEEYSIPPMSYTLITAYDFSIARWHGAQKKTIFLQRIVQNFQEIPMKPALTAWTASAWILIASTNPAFGNNGDEHSEMGHGMHHDHGSAVDNSYKATAEQYSLPDISLLDTQGRRTSLSSVLPSDTPVMLNLIFTTCTAVCPILSATFEEVRDDLMPSRIRMVSISIDPEHDTPERLREYANKYHADSFWGFYTGAQPEIVKLQRALGAYRGDKMNHIPLTYLRSSSSAPWIKIEGFASAEDLIKEYQRILAHP